MYAGNVLRTQKLNTVVAFQSVQAAGMQALFSVLPKMTTTSGASQYSAVAEVSMFCTQTTLVMKKRFLPSQ